MTWRKWLVRGVVFGVTAMLVVGGLVYQQLTAGAAIHRQVLDRLGRHLPGAVVRLDSVRVNLLGGITISDLRLTRRDDPDGAAFLSVPSGVLYHDKEKLLDGRLAIRKIELHRPHLRVVRDPSGQWNLAGILGKPRPDEPVPTVVIRQATILLEDRRPGANWPTLEIREVNLQLLNDPVPVLAFELSGRSELLGPVRVKGHWHRVTEEAALTVGTPEVPLGPAVLGRLAAFCPEAAPQLGGLEGKGWLEAALRYEPTRSSPWSHDVRGRLEGGRLTHERLPFPLEDLQATVRCVGSQVTLEKLTARAGQTTLELSGRATALSLDADLEGRLTVNRLALAPEIFAQLPPLKEIHSLFQPTGHVSIVLDLARRSGQWRQRGRVQAEDLRLLFEKFPYPLEQTTGTIELDIDPAANRDILRVDLVGRASGQAVRVRGRVEGAKPAGVVLDVSGGNIPIDDRLLAALKPEHRELARTFQPTGQVRFEAYVRRPQGQKEYANRIVVQLQQGTARYKEFPYPLQDVSGTLDIHPDYWEFRDFRGSHNGCEVRTSGRSTPTPRGNRLVVSISGSNVPLDGELEAALLKPGLKQAWEVLRPGGRMDFTATVTQQSDRVEPDIEVTVTPRGAAVLPEFFPYPLEHITGRLHYAQGRLRLEQLQARHQDTVVRLHDGEVLVKPRGGVFVNLADVEANPLVPSAAFYQALPPALARVGLALQLSQPLALRTQLIVDVPAGAEEPPIIYWSGGLGLRDARLQAGVQLERVHGIVHCRGRWHGQLEGVVGNVRCDGLEVFGQPFRNVHCQIQVRKEEPDVLILRGIKAEIFGGQVGGEARIEFGPVPRYQVDLTASQVRLEELGAHNFRKDARLSGLASARLYLHGQGTELGGLEGRGSIDVPNGKLYNLPLLLDLLKALQLRMPDGTAFEEAHVRFTIRGQRVHISRLDLYGNAVSLGGKGELNLDGSDLHLDFYAVWARLVQFLPPLIKDIPPALSQQLLKIKLRGRIDNPKFEREPVPVLVEPLKEWLQELRGQQR